MNQKICDAVVQIADEVIKRESGTTLKKKKAVLDKNVSFMASLEVDSLLALEIISRIEKKFGIKLQEDDFVHFDTLENITDLIERKIAVASQKVLSGKGARSLKVEKAVKKTKSIKAVGSKKPGKLSKKIKAQR
ncbi:MAG: acyl carrier protein [Candidatus Omnitrophota bacterium]